MIVLQFKQIAKFVDDPLIITTPCGSDPEIMLNLYPQQTLAIPPAESSSVLDEKKMSDAPYPVCDVRMLLENVLFLALIGYTLSPKIIPPTYQPEQPINSQFVMEVIPQYKQVSSPAFNMEYIDMDVLSPTSADIPADDIPFPVILEFRLM
ncbi:MAG: hypothetical protein EZS28_037060, partial [Streblomastix strix]